MLYKMLALWTVPEQVHIDEDKLSGVEEARAAGGHHELPDDLGGGAHRDNAGPGGRLPQQALEHSGVGRLLIERDVGDVFVLDSAHVPVILI